MPPAPVRVHTPVHAPADSRLPQVKLLPWSELEDLHRESEPLREQLVVLNNAGYLTINSQPRVNGAPSEDPRHGWGGPGG